MKKCIVVADWAMDTLYAQEFRSALGGYMSSANFPDISFVGTEASTVHTAYIAAQIIETEERLGNPLETVVFVNTDSRLPISPDDAVARPGGFLILLLNSGMYVVGTNAGNSFSLIKHKVQRAFAYAGLKEQPASRARDVYSRLVAHLAESLDAQMEFDEVHTHTIPLLQHAAVGHVDVFGNILTTIHKNDLRERRNFLDMVTVEIGGISKQAQFVEHLFAGQSGELVVYPSSFGPLDNPYLGISAWERKPEELGKTGAAHFGFPKPGTRAAIW